MGPTGLKSRCQQGCVSTGGSREECFLDFCRMWKWPTLLGSVSHLPVSKPAVSHLLISLSVSNLSSPSLVHLWHSCIPLINIRTLANALAHRIGGGVQLFSRVQSCHSLWPHGLQHTRPPCPSPSPGVYSNSCSLSQWCHPTISSSVTPYSSCPQSFPASGSFPMSEFFASAGQSIEASASASVLAMKILSWFPWRLTE